MYGTVVPVGEGGVLIGLIWSVSEKTPWAHIKGVLHGEFHRSRHVFWRRASSEKLHSKPLEIECHHYAGVKRN